MNWRQFKDPIFHMCLAGTVIVSWFLTQEVASSSPFTVMSNICVFEFAELSENIRENSDKLLFKENTKLDGYAGPICPLMIPLSKDDVRGKTDFRITCLIIVQLPEPMKNEVVVHKFHESNLPIDEQFA